MSDLFYRSQCMYLAKIILVELEGQRSDLRSECLMFCIVLATVYKEKKSEKLDNETFKYSFSGLRMYKKEVGIFLFLLGELAWCISMYNRVNEVAVDGGNFGDTVDRVWGHKLSTSFTTRRRI